MSGISYARTCNPGGTLHGGSALQGKELHHEYRQRTHTAYPLPKRARSPSARLLPTNHLRLLLADVPGRFYELRWIVRRRALDDLQIDLADAALDVYVKDNIRFAVGVVDV